MMCDFLDFSLDSLKDSILSRVDILSSLFEANKSFFENISSFSKCFGFIMSITDFLSKHEKAADNLCEVHYRIAWLATNVAKLLCQQQNLETDDHFKSFLDRMNANCENFNSIVSKFSDRGKCKETLDGNGDLNEIVEIHEETKALEKDLVMFVQIDNLGIIESIPSKIEKVLDAKMEKFNDSFDSIEELKTVVVSLAETIKNKENNENDANCQPIEIDYNELACKEQRDFEGCSIEKGKYRYNTSEKTETIDVQIVIFKELKKYKDVIKMCVDPKFRCPFISRIYGITNRYDDWGIVMEDYEETLEDVINVLSDVEKDRYLLQLAKAVHYCHSKKFIHRNIHPGNVLIRNDGTCALFNFGLARDFSRASRTSRLGTGRFMPPEMFTTDDELSTVVNYGIDSWAYCLTYFYVNTGIIPYDWVKLEMNISVSVANKERPFKDDDIRNVPRFRYISQCFNDVPTQRPKLSEIIQNWNIE
eukprot:TRINITY_DN3263_c1_g1_i13.p1 TRINITY_DN3263_c1_g1~~TRINITY_DN3263_c1_g1_i13.p1  ORF type:complete len:477 (-),score=126.94 TRINITY_DN3263_c1_g1_i13:601-2031(-)